MTEVSAHGERDSKRKRTHTILKRTRKKVGMNFANGKEGGRKISDALGIVKDKSRFISKNTIVNVHESIKGLLYGQSLSN